jgi:hypothetical protein
MLPWHDRLEYVLGSPGRFSPRPQVPFAPKVKAFLAALSERLLADPEVRTLPDVVSFAYWCRKSNIERQAADLGGTRLRLGRGVTFHIPPTNVPVNFAFSWVFGLLAGNANVLRLPNADFPQVPAILRHIEALFADEAHRELADMNVFVRYAHEEEITAAFSALCDVRIIWGGDAVVLGIRKAPLSPRGVEVAFPDRTSFAVFGSAQVAAMRDEEVTRLAAGFYNDTYLMDQNACSSPRLVVWLGKAQAKSAQERFWAAVEREVARRGYQVPPISAVDKLLQTCRDAITLKGPSHLTTAGNVIYRLAVPLVSRELEGRRCSCGYFYEFTTDVLDELADVITWKYQTLAYAGVSKDDLARFVTDHRMPGIDRIVPVGSAMDIGLVWDGYDLIATLSRVCDVR